MRALFLSVFLVGCGFPNVLFAPAEAGTDASEDEDAEADTGLPDHVDPPLPDGGDGGKPTLMDSGKPCDKDNDTYVDQNCSMGNDCDDTDPRANPSVSKFLYLQATQTTKGDWNCDHQIDTEVKIVGLKCSDYPYGTNCGALGPGFETNPPCGYFANYVTCKSGGLLANCTVATTVMKQQGCK